MSVAVIDEAQLQDLLAKGKPVVADFYADWCGPCRAVAPEVNALAERFGPDVEFVKVDVDANPDLARGLRISTIPTFVHFSGDGHEVARFTGAARADDLALRLQLV